MGADPAIAATSLIAVDMGGYQLAHRLADSPESWIMAMIVGYMAGATIVFSIPVGLALLDKEDDKYLALGVLSGILSVPVGVGISSVIIALTDPSVRASPQTDGPSTVELHLEFVTIALNLIPLVAFVGLIALGLRLFPNAMIRGFMIFGRFLDARTLADDDLQDPALLLRLAHTIRQIHSASDQLTGELLFFCPFQTVRTYTQTAREHGAVLPPDIDQLVEDSRDLSLRMSPLRPTLCHNDLLAANIMDDGERLWLVDWEYGGIGNPLFDLAGVSANAGLSDQLEAHLLEAYTGSVSDGLLHEVRILKTASLLREALWAVIQTVMSDFDFDYAEYATGNFAKYRQARLDLDKAS